MIYYKTKGYNSRSAVKHISKAFKCKHNVQRRHHTLPNWYFVVYDVRVLVLSPIKYIPQSDKQWKQNTRWWREREKNRRKIIRQIRQYEKEKLKILYSNIYPTRCNVTQSILSGNCSTCFWWYHHPSPGAQTTVSTASGICHTVTATCHNTLKPVPTLPR